MERLRLKCLNGARGPPVDLGISAKEGEHILAEDHAVMRLRSINHESDFPAATPLKSSSFPSDVTFQDLGGRLDQVLHALSCVLYLAPLATKIGQVW